MNYRTLPQTDLQLSEISFGCMSLEGGHSRNEGLLLRALDKGINYFDTADLYQNGQNEITVGKAFKTRRKEIVIATKVGNQMRPDGSGWDWNPRKEYILEAVKRSLKRLQTDYIDLYQLHGGTIDDPTDETIEAFELLKEKGMIRHYGISSIRPNVIRKWAEKSNIVSNMMQYSLLDRRAEENSLELLGAHNIGVIGRGSVAGGRLIGKPIENYLGHTKKEIAVLLDEMKAIADRDLSEIAMKYVLNRQEITSVAVGMRTEDHLKRAITVSETSPLSKEEIMLLSSSINAKIYESHR